MLVNAAKTQFLCIASNLFSSCSSFIQAGDKRIDSQNDMVLLGFAFGRRPTMDAHVNLIKKKYRARSWLIRHLKNAGVPTGDLIKTYSTVVRSVIEYAAAVFHSMLTATQTEDLEGLQRWTLKILYGWDTSYEKAFELTGLPLLEERRTQILERFTEKTAANPRFAAWFPEHEPYPYQIRRPKKINEELAKTNRLRNSPIFMMRRILNSWVSVRVNVFQSWPAVTRRRCSRMISTMW